MKNLFFVLLLSSPISAFSQYDLTIQELLDIYSLKQKELIFKKIISIGFKEAGDIEKRKLFGEISDEVAVFMGNDSVAMVGLVFNGTKVHTVVFVDSTVSINKALNNIGNTGFTLAKQQGEMFKSFTRRKTDYFIMVDWMVYDSVSMLAIMPKGKGFKSAYTKN